ncbi:type I restriction system adenine methylase HsdM [Flavobacteriaceae bacterium MAR_2009_75]|nr:type I restriction system adenine methylase HsdM [Flavobacteriaceae bacterium MAR_2009_75]
MAKTKTAKDEPLKKVLWASANKLRKNIDAAEYKHVVLGLIFLRYISEAFEDLYTKLAEGKGEYEGADPEDKDEYKGENVFFVPTESRWSFLKNNAKKHQIGKFIDTAMDAIEKENSRLKGVLPKVYAKDNLDVTSLGSLVDLISNIAFDKTEKESIDILGEVFEYFLGEFALAEGKKGGQFYTPRSIVELLVEMLEPYKGRVMDPCCGSGGMFVQSENFVKEHQGSVNDISIYGQESNQTTWRLAKMNLAIRGIDSSQVKWNNEGSFLRNELKDVKVDFILANPPFNDDDWSGELLRKDSRWNFGVPPSTNANYAWLQHIVYHLAPKGTAGVLLADTSLSTLYSEEYSIRKSFIENDLVECIVQLPSHLFSNTQIKACIWFLTKNKTNGNNRNRTEEILFMDTSHLGKLIKRNSRVLTRADISKVTATYHKWKKRDKLYKDEFGFCKSAKYELVEANNYNLSPNRYIEPAEQKVDLKISLGNNEFQNIISDCVDKINDSSDNLFDSLKKSNNLKIGFVNSITKASSTLSELSVDLYNALINNYFLERQFENSSGLLNNNDWEDKRFGDLFVERKLRVKDFGFCPKIYSVTNSGIQTREGNFSKELAKSNLNYKVALEGDMVFGLSRQIPNLDVFKHKQGAFSGAYHVFAPLDIRIGLIVGGIMRLKLMEQTDILKGGAREGRGLDKEKLSSKLFLVPSERVLDKLWGAI